MPDMSLPAATVTDSATTLNERVGMVRNSGWNLLGHGLPLLIAVGAIPVVVRELGPTRFGLLALAWTVVGYVTLFDLGFGRATIKRVSELVWGGEGQRVHRVLYTAVVMQLGIGLLTGGMLAWGAAGVARILIAGEAGGSTEATNVIRILAVGLPAVLVSNAYRAVLEGLQRFDLVNLARAPLSASMYLVPLTGVLLGWGLVAIVLALVASRYLGACVYYWLFSRACPAGASGFDRIELGRLWRFGGWVAASNVIIPLTVYLERLVISGVQGVEALAFYAAPHELVSRLLIVPAAVAGALFPVFSGLSGSAESGGLARLVGRGTKLVALAVAPISALLILLAAPLLTVWLGPVYGARSAPVLQILAAAAFLNALAYVPFALIEGRGKPDVVTKYHIIELPIYAGILWYGVQEFGIMGAAVAWGCRMLWTVPIFYAVALSRAEMSLLEPLRGGTARAVAAGIALVIISAALTRSNPPGAVWIGIFVLATFAASVWPLLMDDQDRAAANALHARIRA